MSKSVIMSDVVYELRSAPQTLVLYYKCPRSLTLSDAANNIKRCPDGAPHIPTHCGVFIAPSGVCAPSSWHRSNSKKAVTKERDPSSEQSRTFRNWLVENGRNIGFYMCFFWQNGIYYYVQEIKEDIPTRFLFFLKNLILGSLTLTNWNQIPCLSKL